MHYQKNKRQSLFSRVLRSSRDRPKLLAAIALFVGVAGYGALHRSFASTSTVPHEAENGVVTGNASVSADGAASGGSRVLFGQSSSQPTGLDNASKKEIAMELVSSGENSTLDWRSQYKYIEDIGDGRGYTGGIIGFCSGTGDMLALVQRYTQLKPGNVLAQYIPALRNVNGTASHTGLGAPYEKDWVTAAVDPLFQQAQNFERDETYFNPAVAQAKADGLSVLGQFIYYDAAVMHGADAWGGGFPNIRDNTLKTAKTPTNGGNETTYLSTFLDRREDEMKKEAAHSDLSRVETEQRKFLTEKNFNLDVPLNWSVYGDPYSITTNP